MTRLQHIVALCALYGAMSVALGHSMGSGRFADVPANAAVVIVLARALWLSERRSVRCVRIGSSSVLRQGA